MTVKYTFFVGLSDKDERAQVYDTLTASRLVQGAFLKSGVDCTITNAQGVYTHEDGTIVIENTIMAQCFEFGEHVNVSGICDELKRLLNQESIAVEKTETDSQLY